MVRDGVKNAKSARESVRGAVGGGLRKRSHSKTLQKATYMSEQEVKTNKTDQRKHLHFHNRTSSRKRNN